MRVHAICLYCNSRLRKLATVRDAFCDNVCKLSWQYEEKAQPRLRSARLKVSQKKPCKKCGYPTWRGECYSCFAGLSVPSKTPSY